MATHVETSARLSPQQVVDVMRAAHRAPSIHNTQPWLLRPLPAGIDVLEDVARAVPASDPRGRDRLISCGAAVRNAEVAVARLGRTPSTTLLPDLTAPLVVARVVAGAPRAVTGEVEDLHRAIWERRTHRRIFMARTAGDDVPSSVSLAVRGTGARLGVLPAHRRGPFAQLLWAAAQAQIADDGVRAEIRDWTRQDGLDGVPVRSHGNAPFPVDGLLVHSLTPAGEAPSWVAEALGEGAVAVVLTDGDGREDWVRAGSALESVLLAVTAAGLVASFLNQVVQQDACRPRLAELLGDPGCPQAVLRIGRPLVDVPATPRRPLAQVTIG